MKALEKVIDDIPEDPVTKRLDEAAKTYIKQVTEVDNALEKIRKVEKDIETCSHADRRCKVCVGRAVFKKEAREQASAVARRQAAAALVVQACYRSCMAQYSYHKDTTRTGRTTRMPLGHNNYEEQQEQPIQAEDGNFGNPSFTAAPINLPSDDGATPPERINGR